MRARLDKDTIRAAIATVPPEKAPAARPGEPSVLSSGAYEKFSREFSDARLPGCLRPDGLRNQPTFFLGGVLALPFIAVAKVRGVCR